MADLLLRLFNPAAAAPVVTAAPPNALDDYWYQPRDTSGSGMAVSTEAALHISAVFACVRIISETLASLPLHTYEDMGEEGRRQATEYWLYPILHDAPNDWQSSFEFREMLTGHTALTGNGYAYIEDGGAEGTVLIPLHPGRVKVTLLPTQRLSYEWTRGDGRKVTIPQENMFHVRGPSADGITGMSIVGLARETFGTTIATEGLAGKFFSQAVRPSGVLEHPGTLSEQAYGRLQQRWADTYAGYGKAGSTVILEEGLKWTQVGMSNEDAQFLETRKFQTTEIARWFRISPHMIGELDRATFNNIEQLSLEFATYTMMAWVTRWEGALWRSFFRANPSYYARLSMQAILRGDTQSRYAAYGQGRQWGWLSADDIRELEDMNPIPNGRGQTYLVPLNMSVMDPNARGPAPALIPTGPQNPGQAAALRLLVEEQALKLLDKEVKAINAAARRFAGDAEGWRDWVLAFYGDFVNDLQEGLKLPRAQAKSYVESQRAELFHEGVRVIDGWRETRVETLTQLMLAGVTQCDTST